VVAPTGGAQNILELRSKGNLKKLFKKYKLKLRKYAPFYSNGKKTDDSNLPEDFEKLVKEFKLLKPTKVYTEGGSLPRNERERNQSEVQETHSRIVKVSCPAVAERHESESLKKGFQKCRNSK
jgi:hypothetical protein